MAQPARVVEREPELPADDIVVFRNVTWADYQRFLEIRGERSVPRLTYLEGVLEVMSPSRPHESIKSMVARLVEAWCLEKGVDITPYGSWTHESKEHERGAEPDECYVLGDVTEPERCDLAIQVVWTSGGIDKLKVYEKLGVREVWIWKKNEIGVFSLQSEGYVRLERSELLPDIDLTELVTFVDVKPMTRAVTEYRARLRQ
ncbi:MAG: Uma2 family endonuclease [Luteitalea sp.]|nr:Uma2 family endonuclease [Luteitalea sp.]